MPCPIAATGFLFHPSKYLNSPKPAFCTLQKQYFPQILNSRHTAEPLDTGTRAAAGFSLRCASHTARPSLQDTSPQPCPCACPPLHTLLLLPGAPLHQLSALLIYRDRLGDSQTTGPHAQHALCCCSPPDPSNTQTQVPLHKQNKERGC